MTKNQTVLVGVDGSDGARRAAAWAAHFARATGRTVRAVAAWSYPATAGLPGGPSLRSPEEMDEATRDTAIEVLTEALGEPPTDGMFTVERGPADRAILGAIRSTTTLVVVGKRGLGALEGRILGSVSRRVAELAPIPVAVVPAREVTATGPIVLGVDGSPAAAAARDWAIEAAHDIGTRIIVVHGIAGLPAELPPSAIDRFIDQARAMVEGHVAAIRAAGVEAGTVIEVVDPRMLLRSVAEGEGASMIVIGTRGEGPASGLLVGSVVSHVIQQSDQPVVVVNDR